MPARLQFRQQPIHWLPQFEPECVPAAGHPDLAAPTALAGIDMAQEVLY